MQTEAKDSTTPVSGATDTLLSTIPGSIPGQPGSRAERQEMTAELLDRACATPDGTERDRLIEEVVLLNMCVARSIARRHSG
jgi:RNA polymerase sigma-B factor